MVNLKMLAVELRSSQQNPDQVDKDNMVGTLWPARHHDSLEPVTCPQISSVAVWLLLTLLQDILNSRNNNIVNLLIGQFINLPLPSYNTPWHCYLWSKLLEATLNTYKMIPTQTAVREGLFWVIWYYTKKQTIPTLKLWNQWDKYNTRILIYLSFK